MTNLSYPPIPKEIKKPPGLEHVIPTQQPTAIVAGSSTLKSKVTEDNDEDGDEWPSLGLESLMTPPPNPHKQFSWTAGGTNLPVVPYIPPPPGFNSGVICTEFDILEDAKRLLNHDPDKINYFKVLSGQYQKGQISVAEYSGKCGKLFGTIWKEFGIRLAGTLPTADRRDQLLSVLVNGYEQLINQSVQPPLPPGLVSTSTKTVTNNSSSKGSVNGSDAVSKESKKSKKRRNRNGGNNNNANNAGSSSSGGTGTKVWQHGTAPLLGRHVRLNDSEYPSLDTAVRMPDRPVPVPSWNMKVAVK